MVELACGLRIEEHRDVSVFPEEGRRTFGSDGVVEHGPDRFGLGGTEGEEEDSGIELENRVDAHRHRPDGNKGSILELPYGIVDRDRVKVDDSSLGVTRTARLVEADMPGAPDPEDAQIDASTVGVHLQSRVVGLRACEVWETPMCGEDARRVMQVLPHEVAVRQGVIRAEAFVLVEVPSSDAVEVKARGAAELVDLAVVGDRRVARGASPLKSPVGDDAFRGRHRYKGGLEGRLFGAADADCHYHGGSSFQGEERWVWSVQGRQQEAIENQVEPSFLLVLPRGCEIRLGNEQAAQNYSNGFGESVN